MLSSTESFLMIAKDHTKSMGMVSANVQWLEGVPKHNFGATFGLPWSCGELFPGKTTFLCSGINDVDVPLQSWITAYWQDGSIKWTAHAIPGQPITDSAYTVRAVVDEVKSQQEVVPGTDLIPIITVSGGHDQDFIEVNTGKISVHFSIHGSSIIRSITTKAGGVTGKNGRLVLLSQSSAPREDISDSLPKDFEFEGVVEQATIEQSGPVRAVVALRGRHHLVKTDGDASHIPTIPFILRFYLYANSDAIRLVHTVIFDGDMNNDFIQGIGIRFDIPLGAEKLYDRHVRISGVDGGVLSEAVQSITGLRIDPGPKVREAQVLGRPTPSVEHWDTSIGSRLRWVPSWNDFSLAQLSPDGFNLKKRTGPECSWVKIPGGTRAGGLVYLGGATKGGLAAGLKDFWQRYPTGIDIKNAASAEGTVTLWLYSPQASPMDMRQYHNGLGQATYDEQLDALNITYEDWEPEIGTPYGIARTNEIYIFSFEHTPDRRTIGEVTEYVQKPPVLMPNSDLIYHKKVFGNFWAPSIQTELSDPITSSVHDNLRFLFEFYQSQVLQRRWYGFWDHGDIMHAYDEDRHTWRYDIGGYAWDNSELSPDLWLWLYFLQTGRADVYRMAEALTRHTGEVDVYHIGKHKGLGTRHGVQHWSDSCKQARISNALYRKYFYFLSGGDERVGELLEEVLDTENAFLALDPYRKVRKDKQSYTPNPLALSISLGTDWAALASAWLIEVERRGPRWRGAQKKLLASFKGIASLTNGFVTGTALYNMTTGDLSPPSHDPDNKGVVQISHLSAMFGLFEVCAEIIDTYPAEVAENFEVAWLEYCRYFNGTDEEQFSRYGVKFGKLQLRQGHSRLTAYAAKRLDDSELARRAWEQFSLEGGFGEEDGYGPETTWSKTQSNTGESLIPVEEATWVSTNITALYGIAAIQNLALIGDRLKEIDQR